MQDCFKLLHFHLGSQIPNIRIVKRRAQRGGAGLCRAGASAAPGWNTSTSAAAWASTTTARRPTSNRASTTRSQEYANDVVYHIQTRVRRSRRAASDDHLGERPRRRRLPQRAGLQRAGRRRPGRTATTMPLDIPPEIASSRCSTWSRPIKNVTARNALESYPRRPAGARHGDEPVHRRLPAARAARPWPRTCSGRSARRSSGWPSRSTTCPRNWKASTRCCRDTYFCNFSLFQSMPDSWAIKQLFPGDADSPARTSGRRGTPCSATSPATSDGKIDQFIDRRDVKTHAAAAPVQRRALLPRRVPDRRLPGNPRRPAQPVRRHERRPRRPRRPAATSCSKR